MTYDVRWGGRFWETSASVDMLGRELTVAIITGGQAHRPSEPAH